MKILAIGCHPDDLEINCFGTLAKYVKRGDDVFVCNVANGCMGHMSIPPEELAVIRQREAEEASKVIGVKEYINLGANDLEVVSYDKELIKAMVNIIRYTKPCVIITHAANDYQRDHNEVHDLVFNTSFMSSIPHYKTKHPVHPIIPPIYYMEPSSGNAFTPTHYVDISDTIDLKLKALSCHKSQVEWLNDHVEKDVLETTKANAISRGRLCSTKFAEAFIRCDQVLRMDPKSYLP